MEHIAEDTGGGKRSVFEELNAQSTEVAPLSGVRPPLRHEGTQEFPSVRRSDPDVLGNAAHGYVLRIWDGPSGNRVFSAIASAKFRAKAQMRPVNGPGGWTTRVNPGFRH